MSLGHVEVKGATLASAATLSAEVNLTKAYRDVFVEVPTIASASTMYIQAASELGGTFRRIVELAAGVEVEVEITSPSNKMVRIPAGLRNLKIELTSAPSAAVEFKVIAGN